MFDGDKRAFAKMAPKLKRVLIADPQTASSRLLSELLRDIASSHIWTAQTTAAAFKIAETCDPQLIVADIGPAGVDGLALTRKLRRSQLPCRKAPVIAVTGAATAASILAARDAGVHEVMRKPFSVKDLVRRLEAVTLKDRDWVEAVGYIGPDRRRFNSGDYSGPLKRQNDAGETPHQQKLKQALKIIRAAAPAADADPQQALRAMLAQATTIQALATDFQLSVAASELYRNLARAAQSGGRISRADAERWAAPLLAFLPKDGDESVAA